MFQVFRTTLSSLLLLAALGWLAVSGWGERERWQMHTEHGGSQWLRWFDGEQMTGVHGNHQGLDGMVSLALHHMQCSMNRPLELLWLRYPQWRGVPYTTEQFTWGRMASALHPGYLRVDERERRWREVDGVVMPVRRWQDWLQQPGMEGIENRFPHRVDIARLVRIAVTEDLEPLVHGLDSHFWATVQPWFEHNKDGIHERIRARWQALAWAVVFFFMLGLQGWLLLYAVGVAGARAVDRAPSPWLTLSLAVAVGSMLEFMVLWLAGTLGITMGPWTWRLLHLIPLAVALWLWRRHLLTARATQTEGGSATSRDTDKQTRQWSVAGLLAVVAGAGLLLLASGPGPLRDAPGMTRDGYKAQRFFEHGGISITALIPNEEAAVERGFSRPAYPPAWPGLAYAMSLWCGSFEATPFNVLPAFLMATALTLLAGVAASWFPGRDPDTSMRRATARALWLALAVSVPITAYCRRFYAEPWLLLLLLGAWGLWLGLGHATSSRRLPWPQVLLAAALLGAACLVKREGLLWAGLGLAALPFLGGIDWRRWLASVVVVGLCVLPVVAWRLAVGEGLEDFSMRSWHSWREQSVHLERRAETWGEVSRWLWRWPEARAAFALMVPIGLVLWLLSLPCRVIAAGKGNRAGTFCRHIGRSAPLLAVILGGTFAIVAMFEFSNLGDLRHHLSVVWRLLLPVGAAAYLLAAMALAPRRPT